MDLGWVRLGHFHGFPLPSLEVGSGVAAWGETRWKMYVSCFWLWFGFPLFWGCFRDCLLPVLSLPVRRGARFLFPLPVPGGHQELLVTGGVTWHWGELLGEESALTKFLGTGQTNTLQKQFKCCWLCLGAREWAAWLLTLSSVDTRARPAALCHRSASTSFFGQVWRWRSNFITGFITFLEDLWRPHAEI